ncbi:MAG: tetratricopeptide repeat protein [Bacteroidetes bacterium]|nr:tetratricopeptide repeat protein [Bacteroidota bacterium]
MYQKNSLYFIGFFLMVAAALCSQNRKLDSLIKIFPSSADTVKVQILCSVSRSYEANDPAKALKIADSALTIAKRIHYKMGIGGAYGSVGSCLTTSGKYDEAISALIKALKVFEAEKAKRYITNTYNSLANAYMGLKNEDKAYEYFLKAFNMANEEPRNEHMVAVASVGVGNMLLEKNKFNEAISYYKKSEQYFREKNISNYEAMCITMIGEAYVQDSNYVEAEKYFAKSLPIFRTTNDDYGLAINLANLAGVEIQRKEYKKAETFYKEALQLNLQRKAWDNIQSTALGLAKVEELLGNTKEALANYKLYTQFKDSVINIERNKAVAESESKYESEKKEQQLILKNSELEKSHLKVSQRNNLIYIFGGAMVVFLVLLFFVYKQFREKRKANVLLTNKNSEIEKQKGIIEEKNKDITDSINYSKHIQQAIIPSFKKVREHLPNSFVIFKPKDIVSGDFYLVENIEGLIYLAVVDCTGHGVPGAMLSVFANSTIKNIIAGNRHRSDPAGILSELCRQFKANLQSHKTTLTISDGVDMSLCIIDKAISKIYFAGAKNGLLQVIDGQLIEYAANRWGISGNNGEEHLVFTNHQIEVNKGDKFYLSTDGFIDQFGGPKGKKFKQKQLKDLVVNYSALNFDLQADNLINDFTLWKGLLEQIDDVTLVGFELE